MNCPFLNDEVRVKAHEREGSNLNKLLTRRLWATQDTRATEISKKVFLQLVSFC